MLHSRPSAYERDLRNFMYLFNLLCFRVRCREEVVDMFMSPCVLSRIHVHVPYISAIIHVYIAIVYRAVQVRTCMQEMGAVVAVM